jgi:hypothetical protein
MDVYMYIYFVSQTITNNAELTKGYTKPPKKCSIQVI